MASSSSTSFSASSHDNSRPNTGSVWAVVAAINQQIHEFISDKKTWKSVKLKCTSYIQIQSTDYFEFSEHSVLSNLYWGIENIEVASFSENKEEKVQKLENAEKMLQAPALLDEEGKTADISNKYLICCSYFYLAVAKKLQGDVLKVAIHFLQAILVSPGYVFMDFAPEMCKNLLLCYKSLEGLEWDDRDFGEREICSEMEKMARKYKGWLTYYQVMSYKGTKRVPGYKDVVSPDIKSQSSKKPKSISSTSQQYGNSLGTSSNCDKVHPIGPNECITEEVKPKESYMKQIHKQTKLIKPVDKFQSKEKTKNSNSTCLQEFLTESQSETPISDDYSETYSPEDDEHEVHTDDSTTIKKNVFSTEDTQTESFDQLCTVWKQATPNSTSDPEYVIYHPQFPTYLAHNNTHQENIYCGYLEKCNRSFSANKSLALKLTEMEFYNDYWKNYHLSAADHQGSMGEQKSKFNSEIELMGIIDKAITKLCIGSCDENYASEVVRLYKTLSNKKGVKYTILKEIVLDQLLKAISSSREVGVIRVSISILTIIVSENRTVIKDLNKNGLELYDLASALKRNVHEAAILIHLINPSPVEIKTLELLPILMKIVCSSKMTTTYNSPLALLQLTPPIASLRIIEVLVTAFDNTTNNLHLAAINSPEVFSGLLSAPRENNLEDFTSLAAILVRWIRFDGLCRKYILRSSPMAPFITLLGSNQERTKLIILEFFHEMLRMPRSSSVKLMQQIHREKSIDDMLVLLPLIQELHEDYKLLAANLLLQLDILEDSPGKSTCREVAAKVLLKSLASEENSSMQKLSASILANMGGTYSWTGEPYTVSWLLKKTGFTSLHHRNVIQNICWSDECLHDSGTEKWSNTAAKSITKIGKPLFQALEKGLKSEKREVSRDCLIASSWISYEIARAPNNFRYTASEGLLSAVEPFLYPGFELEERILACLCLYNYASGKGMRRITHFSEGVRESLRRLTSVTWMAQELLRVADYYQPNKWDCAYLGRVWFHHYLYLTLEYKVYVLNSDQSLLLQIYFEHQEKNYENMLRVPNDATSLSCIPRKKFERRISCAHTQILEAGKTNSGAVTALIYYKGQLCSGYADGSIKVWEINGQTTTLLFETKEHKKAVTCFSLFEPLDGLLSGSADKTIKIWQMVQRKLEFVEVIEIKGSVRTLDSQGQTIFAVTKSSQLKVLDSSRMVKDICKAKKVKCMKLANGKVYAGCVDSSIQEINIAYRQEREIKGPSKSWIMQSRPVNSIVVYKDWLYSASTAVDGSSIKEWKRGSKPQISIVPEKGSNVQAMEVVEDFIYLNCSSSTSILQIWLRGTLQKVGRISAGSKITSLLSGNDIILCGTEAGLIKGWIPL